METKLQQDHSWDLLKILSLWRQIFWLCGDQQIRSIRGVLFPGGGRRRNEQYWRLGKASNETLFTLSWKWLLDRRAGPGTKHSCSSIKKRPEHLGKACGRCTEAFISKGSTKRPRTSISISYQLCWFCSPCASSPHPPKAIHSYAYIPPAKGRMIRKMVMEAACWGARPQENRSLPAAHGPSQPCTAWAILMSL